MRKKVNTFSQSIAYHIEDNRSIYIFVTVLFLMGVIFGAIIVNSLSLSQKTDLHTYINQFFGQVAQGEFANSTSMFIQSYAHYIKYIGLMWILGLTIIGVPVILILLFIKGIVVGFTVGFLVSQMGITGFFLSFVSILPQNIIIVPAFIVVSAVSINFSLKMVRQLFIKRSHDTIFHHFLRYSAFILCVCAILAIASGFEAYVSPNLMKWIIK